jgi:carbon monoxide dehydrogenase subunit G
MQFEGLVNINAPREKVWEFLTSPEFVSQCAPGIRSVEVVTPDKQFKATAIVGFGSARVTFQTDVEWMEVYPHRFARMKAHGNTPGSGVDVISEMRLTAHEGTTNLNWKADINVVGSLASTAARLMEGITRNLTNAFFDCVRGKIETEVQPADGRAGEEVEVA